MEKKDLKPAWRIPLFRGNLPGTAPFQKGRKDYRFLKAFGEKHKLETKVDEAGNVLIKSLPLRAWKTERPLCYSRM